MDPRAHQPVVDLNGAWSFAFSDAPVGDDVPSVETIRNNLPVYPATVPGNLELDLLANDLIDEPFFGLNILGLRRFEQTYVYYFRTFEAPDEPGDPVLTFEGLDCFADVAVNGRLVHRASNMLVPQTVDLGGALLAGRDNTLCVAIRPAAVRARDPDLAYPPGLLAADAEYESLYVRKAPHMFGWDIMPRALSAGIWRSVSLRFLPIERLDWAWLDTESIAPDGSACELALHFRAVTRGDRAARYELSLTGVGDGSTFEQRRTLAFDAGAWRFRVENPRLWWPRRRGDPHLYQIRLELIKDGTVLDSLEFRHGIRTIDLTRTSVTTAAGDGDFCFVVNGERVFVMGTNWVPLDAYHSRDAARIPSAVEMLEDLGCNMIRCWGGNVYEDDLLYDACDRAGILVWQDFAMACAIYPQDDAFQRVIRDEAVAVARRLRQHPSLALWAGDNECDQSYVWGGRRRDPNQNVLTRQVIPAVLAQEDGSRPYLASSPYFDPTAFQIGERYVTEDHLWGPRDYFKSDFYTSALCHFVSEIGYMGCPDAETLRSFLSPDRVWPPSGNEEWLLHSTRPVPGLPLHDQRVELVASQIRALFGTTPHALDDFVYASQACQAEALKFFIEMFRAGKWRRTGILWWNLIDGWPQISDAIVDYFGRRKAAYETVKRVQAPLHLVVREPAGASHELVAVSDVRDDHAVDFRVRDLASGRTLAEGAAVALRDAVTPLARVDAREAQALYLLDWTSALGSGRSHYLAGRPPFDLATYRAWMTAANIDGPASSGSGGRTEPTDDLVVEDPVRR